LFKDFARVEFAVHFLNKRWMPVVGQLLSRDAEARLASRWGWHLWIYATREKSGVRSRESEGSATGRGL